MTKLKSLLSCIAAAMLASCSLTPSKPWAEQRIDGKPVQPAGEVARLHFWSAKSFPNNQLANLRWGVKLVEVDGMKVTDVTQITPGKHSVKYSCSFRYSMADAIGVESVGTWTADFTAGEYYYFYPKLLNDGTNNGSTRPPGRCKVVEMGTADPTVTSF